MNKYAILNKKKSIIKDHISNCTNLNEKIIKDEFISHPQICKKLKIISFLSEILRICLYL